MASGSAAEQPAAAASDVSVTEPPDTMRVEAEVVRDLRHSVGNYFHKLYYWVDRIGSEDEPAARAEQVDELAGALERFQKYLETGLRYFEADQASPISMGVGEVARASASVLGTDFPGVTISVELEEAVGKRSVRLDPQRFSTALRVLVGLLGGTAREEFACRLEANSAGDALLTSIEGRGGRTPVEIPVVEWAIARKMIEMQGGALRSSPNGTDENGGCVISLPLDG